MFLRIASTNSGKMAKGGEDVSGSWLKHKGCENTTKDHSDCARVPAQRREGRHEAHMCATQQALVGVGHAAYGRENLQA